MLNGRFDLVVIVSFVGPRTKGRKVQCVSEGSPWGESGLRPDPQAELEAQNKVLRGLLRVTAHGHKVGTPFVWLMDGGNITRLLPQLSGPRARVGIKESVGSLCAYREGGRHAVRVFSSAGLLGHSQPPLRLCPGGHHHRNNSTSDRPESGGREGAPPKELFCDVLSQAESSLDYRRFRLIEPGALKP